ncbi:MAG TPA: glycosyltransferase [Candidatus Binatia bacterium]
MRQATAKLAYLFPVFPVFHQTFVLWEVMGLRRHGVRPKIYSLRRAGRLQQPEGGAIMSEVTYLPPVWSSPVRKANWRLLRTGVRRYLSLYAQVWNAWRTGDDIRHNAGWAKATVSWHEGLRGWFNSQPLLYLLKSWFLVPSAAYLAEELSAEGITHLHVHWASYPATVAYIVQLISGLPFSISAHAYDIYMVQRMLPAKIGSARFVVTCARTNAAFLRRLAGAGADGKVVVNYHGVDVNRFVPAWRQPNAGEPLRIVSCGQLERYKGMHVLVEACATLRRRGVALECFIVGEGPRRQQLQQQIRDRGLTGTVHLLGSRPHAEVAELYRKADVFVLASELAGKSGRRDVIANVIVEAMAAGLPVVVSHIPGVEELVEDGVSGYLVPPNQVEGFALALENLANRPEDRLRCGHAARQRIERDFDSGKNVRLLAELLLTPPEEDGQRPMLAAALQPVGQTLQRTGSTSAVPEMATASRVGKDHPEMFPITDTAAKEG